MSLYNLLNANNIGQFIVEFNCTLTQFRSRHNTRVITYCEQFHANKTKNMNKMC